MKDNTTVWKPAKFKDGLGGPIEECRMLGELWVRKLRRKKKDDNKNRKIGNGSVTNYNRFK